MAAEKVIAEGEQGVPGVGVADDVEISRDDELSRPKRPHNSAAVLFAGAGGVFGPGDVLAAGNLVVGPEEGEVPISPSDLGRRVGPSGLRPE